MAKFLLFKRDGQEILLNVDMIWKIEVSYVKPEGDTKYREGGEANDPNSVRRYKVFSGDDQIPVLSNPDDPVVKELEEIYKNVVRA